MEQFVDSYRRFSHHYSNIDPLGLLPKKEFPGVIDFGLKYDMKTAEQIESSKLLAGVKSVEELENTLKKIYLGPVGVEFDHIDNAEEREWLYNHFEELMSQELTPD
mmetsp:Transcript_16854/g.14755  ORF Transcript_16854/g.14755 Transcript_16854/m.14755 type:complete len:106 (-) Transcript_16854:1551-1868(-)